MEPYKVLASRGVRGRGRFSQSAGRGRASSNSFLGQDRGHARPQQNPRTHKALTSVSTDVILATAGWTEESTFRTFYNKPVAVTNQMSLAVLT
ncbi:unnamed protein product [Porites evermanni]|uniref:Uncharacterized protein n=1 Tax=Porites evermanni TaxID=104178 RepID=A0ABN8SY36_9CNID|nr:unnamed protein product [Porites evermanni]